MFWEINKLPYIKKKLRRHNGPIDLDTISSILRIMDVNKKRIKKHRIPKS